MPKDYGDIVFSNPRVFQGYVATFLGREPEIVEILRAAKARVVVVEPFPGGSFDPEFDGSLAPSRVVDEVERAIEQSEAGPSGVRTLFVAQMHLSWLQHAGLWPRKDGPTCRAPRSQRGVFAGTVGTGEGGALFIDSVWKEGLPTSETVKRALADST